MAHPVLTIGLFADVRLCSSSLVALLGIWESILCSLDSFPPAMTVLENNPKPTETDVAVKNETSVTFNEQTNYVPKRTIITVSG